MERAQIEAPVEAITRHGKVACRVLSKVERMVATQQSGLEIAEGGVDLLELQHLLRLAPGNDGRLVTAACLCDSPKAGQSIGEHRAPRCQMIFRPGGHHLERKAGKRCQPDAQRTIRFAQRNGRNEGHLVLGAASDLATGALAAEVGVIDLDFPFKQITLCAVGHHPHELVVDQPGGGVTHAQLALQGPGRQPGLGLTDQVDRQEPGGQRQLAALKHGAGNQRGLMTARVALKDLADSKTRSASEPLPAPAHIAPRFRSPSEIPASTVRVEIESGSSPFRTPPGVLCG